MAGKKTFYRPNTSDAVRRLSQQAAADGQNDVGWVMLMNADGSAQVRVRGSNNTTPATVVRGLSVVPRDYVLMRMNNAGRWEIYGVANAPAQYGNKVPEGYSGQGARSAGNDAPAVAPTNLTAQGGPALLMIFWTAPGTRGDTIYEVEVSINEDFSADVDSYTIAGTTLAVASTALVTKYIRVRSISGDWSRSGWTDAVSRAALDSSAGGPGSAGVYILLQDQKSAGTPGGTAPSGWFTRDLNTIVNDTTGAVTLVANEFELAAGSYNIDAFSPTYSTGRSPIRLYNVTDSIVEVVGSSDYEATGVFSRMVGRFVIASAKTFRIEQHVEGPGASGAIGLGVSHSQQTEIYTSVVITSSDAGTTPDPVIVQDNGTDLPLRGHLNIIGAATAADDVAHNATIITFGSLPPTDLNGVYIHIRDRKDQGNHGGSSTSGVWSTRDLTEVVTDTTGLVILSGNQFTLPPGTYNIYAAAPGFAINNNQARLYNVTDSTVTLLGQVRYTYFTLPEMIDSVIVGRFTIASQKTFEIQHYCNYTQASTGFGYALNIGDEIYTEVVITTEGASGVDEIEFEFDYTTANGTDISTVLLDNEVVGARLIVSTAFDDPAATLNVGEAGTVERLIAQADNDPTAVGIYDVALDYVYPGTTTIKFYISPGTSSQGAGKVLITLKR